MVGFEYGNTLIMCVCVWVSINNNQYYIVILVNPGTRGVGCSLLFILYEAVYDFTMFMLA